MSKDLTVGGHVVFASIQEQEQQWELLQRQCKAFVSSGLLPDHITRAQNPTAAAITIAIKGRELGIPPMQAFSSITVIKGKPCLSAELMLALVHQRIKGAIADFEKTDSKIAVLNVSRPPSKKVQSFSFTIEDAKTAGLLSGAAWTKYPAAMLRARVISAACRAVFPDAIMGCYTPEEMGSEIIDISPEVDIQPQIKEHHESSHEAPPPKETIADDFAEYEARQKEEEEAPFDDFAPPKPKNNPSHGPTLDDYGKTINCPKCGATPMRFVHTDTPFYGCPNFKNKGCKGTMNANPKTGEPLP